MMRHVELVIMFVLILLLAGCEKLKAIPDQDINAFDKLITKVNNVSAVGYDLREMETFEVGHIKGFVCARVAIDGNLNTLDEVISNISNLYDKRKTIVLICEDGTDSKYIYEKLTDLGYDNVYYFISGYTGYSQIKGDAFIPEEGCGC